MNTLNRAFELIHKLKNLFFYFLNIYSKPLLTLTSIDKNRTTVYYVNRINRKMFSKHVKELFENNSLIYYFNSTDAAQIGYLYGIWIQSSD